MGRQRIDLGDSGHGGHEGGTYGSSGSHQIAVRVGLPHQLLGNDIHNRESIGNDGVQLFLQTLRYHLGQLPAIDGMGFLVTDVTERLIRILDNRRTLIRAHRGNPFDHIRNLIRVSDDYLFCFIASEIFKFRQHFLGSPKIQRRLIVRVLEALSGHDNPAVDLVLRVQEMHVAGGHHRLMELLSQGHDLLIQADQIVLRLEGGPFSPQHKFVIAQRLNLQVVVEVHQSRNLLIRGRPHQRLIELSGLAGGSYDQSLPVLLEHAFGDSGHPGKIIHMGPGYHPVQIHPANLIFRQNNHMVGRQLLNGVRVQGTHPVDAVQVENIPLFQHLHKLHENFRGTACVVHGPMMIFQRHIQGFRHCVQLETVQLGQQNPGQRHRIHHGELAGQALALAVFADEAHIEARIVGHHDRTLAEIQEFRQDFLDGGLVHDHLIVDAGQLLNLEGNRGLGIHEYTEFVRDLTLFHPHGSDLNDPVIFRGKAGGLNVEDHIGVVQALSGRVGDDILQVVDQIALHAVNDLEIIALFQAVAGCRVSLYHAVIRHRNSLMSPGFRPLDDVLHFRDTVHITHLRMTMKLHPFQLTVVYPRRPEIRRFFNSHHGADGQLVVKTVHGGKTLQLDEGSLFQLLPEGFHFVIFLEDFDTDGVRVIGHRDGYNGLLAADLPLVPAGHLAVDDHLAHFSDDLHQIDELAVVKITTVKHVRIVAGATASETSAGTQGLAVGVLAFAEIAKVLLAACGCSRRLLLSFHTAGAADVSCCRTVSARAFRVLCTLRSVCCLLGRPHGRIQGLRLLLHVRTAAALLLFFLFIHKLHLDFHIQSTSFRENLIQNADKFVGRVLTQSGLRKFHFQDIGFRKLDLRPPEQVVLQHAVMAQLKENAVLIELHQLLRVILARQLIALQNPDRDIRRPEELLF